jgi:hypothetical protein
VNRFLGMVIDGWRRFRPPHGFSKKGENGLVGPGGEDGYSAWNENAIELRESFMA